MLLFALQHTIFMLYNHTELKPATFAEILSSYYYALAMDLAATSFLISIPILLIIISFFLKRKKIITTSIHVVNYILIFFCILIPLIDTGIYSVWGSKLNSKAVSYMAYPKESFDALKAGPVWLFFLVLIAECLVLFYSYRKIIRIDLSAKIKIPYKIIFPPVIIFALIIGMRGGFQMYPINKSWVYYSKYPVLNNAALNGFWNFMEILVSPDEKENPYKYFELEKARAITNSMHKTEKDTCEHILTVPHPNIVLILMESVSAECLTKLGGEPGIMPHLDSLTKNSLWFSDFYASGFRTEQGLIALLCGFPAQPKTTILRKFGKFDKLDNMPKILGQNGYSENYYYSGEIEFANTDAFLKLSGFSKILDKTSYPWHKKTDWGSYDDELFASQLKESANDKQPFFSIIMTSTNHEPFDADVEKVFKGNDRADFYKNTAHYTDKCIYDYLQQAASQPWFNNTLFIITSDHAHSYPKARAANDPERHHVPLIFYGNVIKPEYRGKQISTIGCQTDLPAMLLPQLNIPTKEFAKSNNLFNKYAPGFAFYTFDNGFGIITPQQTLVFDHDLKQVVYRKNNVADTVDKHILEYGKAYLETLFEDYLKINN